MGHMAVKKGISTETAVREAPISSTSEARDLPSSSKLLEDVPQNRSRGKVGKLAELRDARAAPGVPELMRALSREMKLYIFSFLSIKDLCTMAQVNKEYNELCCSDTLWEAYANSMGIVKADDARDWKWNVNAAYCGVLHGKTFDDSDPARILNMRGDVWIGDPMNALFTGEHNKGRWEKEFLPLVLSKEKLGALDAIITYRGLQFALVHTHEKGTHYVTRRNHLFGQCTSVSGMLAVVPRLLLNILEVENGQRVPTTGKGGLVVKNVDGRICTNKDGDFLITARRPEKGVRMTLGSFEWKYDVDVLVVTGGDWAEESDESGDESDDGLADSYGDLQWKTSGGEEEEVCDPSQLAELVDQGTKVEKPEEEVEKGEERDSSVKEMPVMEGGSSKVGNVISREASKGEMGSTVTREIPCSEL